MTTKSFELPTGGLSNVFCFPRGESLANWNSLKRAATAIASPNLGQYTFDPSDSYSSWAVFVSSSQPTHWNQAEPIVIDTSVSTFSTVLLPTSSTIPDKIEGNTIPMFFGAGLVVPIPIVNADGSAANLSGKTFEFVVTENKKTEVLLIPFSSLVVSSNVVTVTLPKSLAVRVGRDLNWAIRLTSSTLEEPIAFGRIEVVYAAKKA